MTARLTHRRLVVPLLLMAACVLGWLLLKSIRSQKLPYHDRFAEKSANEWQAFDGTWSLTNDMVINRSDDRGAKLVTGSTKWKDYRVAADMQMLGHGGDIGLMVRVDKPEYGINSYQGYYFGMRSRDNALVMGVAGHDWLETRPVPMPGGVQSGGWYRLEIIAVGCEFAAHLLNLSTGQSTWGAMKPDSCFTSGKIGLRSLDTGAAWKNVSAQKATQADLGDLRKHASSAEAPEFPTREAEYSRMTLGYFHGASGLVRSLLRRSSAPLPEANPPEYPLRSIRSIEATQPGDLASIRGVVTLTQPLHVEDTTGGVAVRLLTPMLLNVGDEVELSGRMLAGQTPSFEAKTARLLWDGTPIMAASITSNQAASGSFEGSLVELHGELSAKRYSEDGTYVLDMTDIDQHFRVIVPQGISDEIPKQWRTGSMLRIHGVCTAPPVPEMNEVSFLLLTRSDADVDILSGPPWNRGARLYALIAAGVAFILIAFILYFKAERWRMRAVLHERERIAMEMHDTLAQSFAGVGFHLQSIRKGLQGHGSVPANLMQKLDVACAMTAYTHREASERITALHPSSHAGDVLTLLQRSTINMLNGSHLPLRMERTGDAHPFSLAVHEALLNVGKEGIANVLRHSKASRMVLRMEYEEHRAHLVIEDDGEGFDVQKESCGFGIQSMRSRAEGVGATLEVTSEPGQGTRIRMTTPYGRHISMLDWVRFQYDRLTGSL